MSRPAFARTFDVARRLLGGETITWSRFTARGTTITRRRAASEGYDSKAFSDVYEASRAFVAIVRAGGSEW